MHMEHEAARDGLVLVGFGKHKLADMMGWIDTDREMELLVAFKKWGPVYREQAACEPEDIQTAVLFLKYLNDVIVEYNKFEKENTDGN
jgi:hypothetical protein